MKRKKSQKNKEVFFLAGLPRSGNTILSSILNQNPDVCCTPNSITLEIYKDLFLLKQTDVFMNYPDHKSLDNVQKWSRNTRIERFLCDIENP